MSTTRKHKAPHGSAKRAASKPTHSERLVARAILHCVYVEPTADMLVVSKHPSGIYGNRLSAVLKSMRKKGFVTSTLRNIALTELGTSIAKEPII